MAFNPNIPAYSTQGKSFSRTAPFPLEGYEIWTDYDALVAYAANTDPAKDPSYIGQKVAYIDTANNKVVHYGIEIDGTLKELGAAPIGDGLSIEIVDGKIQVKGFGDHYYAYIASNVLQGEYATVDALPTEFEPALTEAMYYQIGETWYTIGVGGTAWSVATDTTGIRATSTYVLTEGFKSGLEPRIRINDDSQLEIAWYEPSSETVEGISSKVQSVQQTVEQVEENVTKVESEVVDLQESVYGEGGTAEAPAKGSIADNVNNLVDTVGNEDDQLGETVDTLWANVNSLKAKDVDLESRVATIEGDYLVEADKTELAGATTAVSDRVAVIEGDYLKAADKTELDGKITAVADRATDLENKVDTGDQTVSAYVAAQITNAQIGKLTKVIADSVDIEGNKVTIDGEVTDPAEHVIYMVKVEGASGDAYKEYMLINGVLVQTGDTTTDLSDYYTKSEIDGKVTTINNAISAETEAREALAEKVTALEEIDNATQAELDAYKTEVTNAIATAKQEAIDAAAEAEEAKGYAVAAEVANTYATKQEITDAGYAVASEVAETYATKAALEEVSTVAGNAAQKVETLEDKIDEITSVGGEPNVIEYIQVNGVAQTVTEKTVNITVPTKFSDLTNDSGFDARITTAQDRADAAYTLAETANTQATQNKTNLATLQSNFDTIVTTGDTSLVAKVSALENADTQINAEITALKQIDTDLQGTVAGHTTKITALESKDSELAGLIQANTDKFANYSTTEQMNTAISTALEGFDQSALETAIANNKSAIEAIYKKDGETETGLLVDEIARAKAAEKVNSDAITVLNGNDAGKSVRAIAAEELAAQLIPESAKESLDTLTEIANWIQSHPDDAAAMNSKIAALEGKVDIGDQTVSEYVAAQITASAFDLPIATATVLGGVISAQDTEVDGVAVVAANAVYVAADTGAMSIKKITTDILENGVNELVLFGGTASAAN